MRIRILLVAALAMLLCGCSREAPEPTLMTVEIPEPTQPLTVAPETYPDTAEYYISNVYSEQLGQYYRALLERWGPEQFEQQGRSPLGAAYLQGDPLENVGFFLEDLDGDGSRELVIGAVREAEKAPLIFELWTAGEEPELILRAEEGERYFFLEGSSCLIAREDGDSLRRRAFCQGELSPRDVDAAPASYWVPRYYPFFLYAP